MNIVRAIRQLRRAAGLEPSFADYIAPAAGLLTVGMLAGAGIALLFAPTSGKKLREDMENKISDLRSRFLLEEGGTKEGGTKRAIHQNNIQAAEPFPRG